MRKCYFLKAYVFKFTCDTHTHTYIYIYIEEETQISRATRFGLTVRGSNTGGGDIFRTRPERPWVPPSILYSGYRVIPGYKEAGVWRLISTTSSAEVQEGAKLYFYVPSGLSWPVIG